MKIMMISIEKFSEPSVKRMETVEPFNFDFIDIKWTFDLYFCRLNRKGRITRMSDELAFTLRRMRFMKCG